MVSIYGLAEGRMGPDHHADAPEPADADAAGISLGCIVVDGAFYDRVVAPLLGKQRGVVYVLPDSRHWTEVFGAATGG